MLILERLGTSVGEGIIHMGQYNTNEICQLCGVSRKQLRYYEERGILSAVPGIGFFL